MSMCMDAEQKGTGVHSYKYDALVTRAGEIIRNLSLDEIPRFSIPFRG